MAAWSEMDWSAASAAMDGMVAGVFDKQAVTIVPKTAGMDTSAPTQDDASRASFTRQASLELLPNAMPAAQRPAGDPAAGTRQTYYAAVLTANVGDWPYEPRRGDHVIEALPGGGSRRYIVAAREADGSGRPAYYLNRAK